MDLWARYDNSKDNPRNPQNPPKRVTYGEQTSNEMCIAFLQLTVDGLRAPALGADPGDGAARAGEGLGRGAIRSRLQEMRAGRGAGQ